MDDDDLPRRAFLASNRGDVETFLSCLADDAEWLSAGLFLHPAGMYRGRAAIRDALAATAAHHGALPRVTLRELCPGAGRVLVTATITIPSSRRSATLPVAWIMDVRDGAIARVKTFRGEQQARAEFTAA